MATDSAEGRQHCTTTQRALQPKDVDVVASTEESGVTNWKRVVNSFTIGVPVGDCATASNAGGACDPCDCVNDRACCGGAAAAAAAAADDEKEED